MTGERKNSGSSYVRSPQLENSPVLSIEAPADGDIREKYEQDLTEELDVKFEDPFRSASRSASSGKSVGRHPKYTTYRMSISTLAFTRSTTG